MPRIGLAWSARAFGEVGGRWSTEATDFVSQLAKAKARSEPFWVRQRIEQAWRLRWTGLLACAAARSFAAAPKSHEVECDHRFAGLSG